MTDQIEARRIDVVFPFYRGTAGLRIKDGVIEVAYHGLAPRRVPMGVTLEGSECTIVSARPSSLTSGMIVLTAQRG